ncbi:unnamed protein product [Brassicogethes aeneus]|uniref:Cytochrome P450 n=1 Tax=Brassicogethes aeneus TaxID=1431903 RepID=A0A9P0BD04_BRAAE|nr:unnamed protein product [Brassicogethes aeneus]
MIGWLIILVTFLGYLYLKHVYSYWNRKGVPGPKPTFFFGNIGLTFLRKKSMGEIFTDIYRQYEDHPFVGVYRAATPCLIIKDPDFIKDVTVKHFKCFENNDVEVPEHKNPLIGRNPFVSNDAEWKKLRSQLTGAFTSGKMKSLFPIVNEIGQEFVEYLNKQIAQSKETSIDCRSEMGKFTLQNVANFSVGIDAKAFEDEDGDFKFIANNFITPGWGDFTTNFIFILPYWFNLFKIEVFNKAVDLKTLSIVEECLKYRQASNITRYDVLNHLQNQSKDFNLIEIASGVSALIMDGYDTSASVLTYVIYQLSINEEIQSKLRNEIEEKLNDCEDKMTYEVVQDMKYLDSCIMETLRLHPIFLTLGKRCNNSYTYTTSEDSSFKKMSVTVEPGTTVIIPVTGLHTDPKYFEKPDEFNPDRFLNNVEIPKYVYMPFGEGPRACLGRQFGLLQLKIALVYLVKNFQLRLSEESDKELKIEPWHFIKAPVGKIKINLKKI